MELTKWLSISDRYTKMYLDRLLAPLGLNSSQHMYIVIVCQNPGITQDQLFNSFYIHPSNITRSIAFLEKEEFLKREKSSADKRTSRLYPTEKATEACNKIIKICSDWHQALLKDFSPEEQEFFLQLLQRTAMTAVGLQKEAECCHPDTIIDNRKGD